MGYPARAEPEVSRMPEAADGERYEGLNLTPPAEGFEPYRHKNAGETKAGCWSGLYWARRNEAGDYEIRAVAQEGEHTRCREASSPKKVSRTTTEKANPPETLRRQT